MLSSSAFLSMSQDAKISIPAVAGTASWKHALKMLHMAGWTTGSYWPS